MPLIVLCWANCSADKFLAAGERPWCRHPLHLSHSGQQGTKTAAPDIPRTWEDQPYVLSKPSFVELVLVQGNVFWVILYLLADLAGVNFIIVVYCWGHADSVVGILVDCNLDLLVEANGTGGVSGVLQPTCHLHAILSLLSQRRRWLSRKRWGFWLVFIFIEVIIWELWNLLYFLIVIKGLTWLVVIALALSALLDKYCCIGEITLQ